MGSPPAMPQPQGWLHGGDRWRGILGWGVQLQGMALASHCPMLSLQKEVDETLTTNVWLEHVSRDRHHGYNKEWAMGLPSVVSG